MARFEDELSYYRPSIEITNTTQTLLNNPTQTAAVNVSVLDSSKISMSLGIYLI